MILTTVCAVRYWLGGMIIALILLPSWVHAQGSPPQLTLISPMLVLEQASNTGSVWLQLRNDSSTSVPVSLSSGDFISTITKRGLGAKVTFSESTQTTGTPAYTGADIPAKGTRLVKMDVTNLWEAGESKADLYNNGAKIGEVIAQKYRLPFAVKLDVATPDKPEVSFERCEPGSLRLKNDDSITYPVHWELFLGGKTLQGPDVRLPANSSVRLNITPVNAKCFTAWRSGVFKEATQDGVMTLSIPSSTPTDQPYWSVKTIPVQVHFRSSFGQRLLGSVVIFALLVLGGMCSLILSYWVPNRLQRLDLKEQLAVLARKTRDLSSHIDSSLRVLVRVERYLIERLLVSRAGFSPQLASIFTQVTQRSTRLNKQIDQLEQIDTLYDHVAHLHAAHRPPTLVTTIQDTLQKASDLLQQIELQDADFQNSQTLINDARKCVENLGQEDKDFADKLAKRVTTLWSDFDAAAGRIGGRETCKNIRDQLPGLFEVIKDESFTKPESIVPEHYRWIDMNTSKLELIRDYVLLYEYSKSRQAELQNQQQKLVQYLSLESREALRRAQLMLQQMREGIYPDNLTQAIQAGDQAVYIDMDPGAASVNQPVRLSVWFRRGDFNGSAACEEFVCVWDFGHDGRSDLGQMQKASNFVREQARRAVATIQRAEPAQPPQHPEQGKAANLTEQGRTVSHFFPAAREYTVQVHFEDATTGQAVQDASGQTVILQKPIQVALAQQERLGERTWTEGIRLVIALFAAVIALFAGAWEQLLKLGVGPGLIAVFLLGFGADTIKNLLTPRQ